MTVKNDTPCPQNPPQQQTSPLSRHQDDALEVFESNDYNGASVDICTFNIKPCKHIDIWIILYHIDDVRHPLRGVYSARAAELEVSFATTSLITSSTSSSYSLCSLLACLPAFWISQHFGCLRNANGAARRLLCHTWIRASQPQRVESSRPVRGPDTAVTAVSNAR